MVFTIDPPFRGLSVPQYRSDCMIALQVGFIWKKGLGKSSVDVYTHGHTHTKLQNAEQSLSHYCKHVCD